MTDKDILTHILSEKIDIGRLNDYTESSYYADNFIFFINKIKKFKQERMDDYYKLCKMLLG